MFIIFKLAHNEKVHHQNQNREHVEHVDKEEDRHVEDLELIQRRVGVGQA